MISNFRSEHAFLSNFYLAKVELDGLTYPTVEHAYQASKSTSGFERRFISTLKTPGEAKRVGNSRLLEFRADWEDTKLAIMADLVHQKFTDPILGKLLIDTYPDDLVEGNDWHDTFWGKCYCSRHKGEGLNHLGEILMDLREELAYRQEEALSASKVA